MEQGRKRPEIRGSAPRDATRGPPSAYRGAIRQQMQKQSVKQILRTQDHTAGAYTISETYVRAEDHTASA